MYARRLDPSVLAFSLSLHRHPSICILFSSPFTSHSKQTERNSKTDIFSPGMDLLFHSDVLTSSIFVLDKKLTPSLVLFPQLSSQAEHDHQKNIPLLNMMTHHVYMIICNMIQLFIDMEKKFMCSLNKVHVKDFKSCTHNMYLKLSC